MVGWKNLALVIIPLILLCLPSCKKVEEGRPAVSETAPTRTTPATAALLAEGKLVKGQLAPDISWGYDAGERLLAVKGDVVLLCFFSPDVELCKKQLEVLKELWTRRRSMGFTIVGLVAGNNSTALNEIIQANLLPYAYAWAGKSLVAAMDGLPALPTTVVIDRSGRVATIAMGFRDLETWEVNLSPLLSAPAELPPVADTKPQ
jgi:peroxiredoxin